MRDCVRIFKALFQVHLWWRRETTDTQHPAKAYKVGGGWLADFRERLDCLLTLDCGANNRNLIDEDRLIRDVVHTFGKSYLELVRFFPTSPRYWIYDSEFGQRGRRTSRSLIAVLMDAFLSGVLLCVKDSPGPVCLSAQSAADLHRRRKRLATAVSDFQSRVDDDLPVSSWFAVVTR